MWESFPWSLPIPSKYSHTCNWKLEEWQCRISRTSRISKISRISSISRTSTSSAAQFWAPLAWSSFSFSLSSSSLASSGPWKDFSYNLWNFCAWLIWLFTTQGNLLSAALVDLCNDKKDGLSWQCIRSKTVQRVGRRISSLRLKDSQLTCSDQQQTIAAFNKLPTAGKWFHSSLWTKAENAKRERKSWISIPARTLLPLGRISLRSTMEERALFGLPCFFGINSFFASLSHFL